MSDSSSRKPEDPSAKAPKKPRGLGGILLIMALLMALFFVVSQSNLEEEAGLYKFYQRLFNGQIYKASIEGNTLTALYTPEPGEPERQKRMEVVLREYLERDTDLIREILPLSMDRITYGGAGLGRFVNDVESGEIQVQRAFLITEHEPRQRRPATEESAPSSATNEYLAAIVLRGNERSFVRVDHDGGGGVDLAKAEAQLAAAGVPLEHRALSLDAQAFVIKEPNTALIYFLGTIGPYLLVILIVWFFIIRQMRAPGGTGGVLSFGRSRAALYTKENRTNVTFDDVAGIEEAKDEVREIIEFLKNPGKFAKLGGSIPRGVLLVGSPGTGKTLLAKAIAGEAEVPFFSISGSDFVEMFVGVGASRVRDLFKQARECSPCLVFLDEIDAVGRKRGSGMGGGHDEREQTLNAILVEMDGFDSDKGIILIAATNRPDVLDPALLRPGRFDRQIVIDMPDVKGRESILKVHSRKVKILPTIDLKKIARATASFSGADLAALINEAAILAAMKGKEAVDMNDLEEARDRVKWGREKRSRAMEEEDRRVTAYHEAGHALVSSLVPGLDPVHKVTIVSRGMALGATMSLPERDDYHMRKTKLLGMIAMCYGGRIAEDVVFGDISAGAQNDIEKATHLAKVMVCELGMSEKVGPVKYAMDQDSPFLGREFRLSADLSPQTLELIDGEVRQILDVQYQRAKDLIESNRPHLDLIAEGLLKYETLTGDEVGAVLRGDDLGEFRAARERKEAQAARAAEAAAQRDEPDVGLSGAEGLAHG
ncbi:MAG: ATP-dependent zinc metalloprotease FtsH [Planctomycetota bacterium]